MSLACQETVSSNNSLLRKTNKCFFPAKLMRDNNAAIICAKTPESNKIRDQVNVCAH